MPRGMTGAVISRLKHSDEISIPTASTVLHRRDYIQAVGSEESLNPTRSAGRRA